MDFTPKDREKGSQKVKQDFVKKCAIVSYFRRKNKAKQLYKTLDGGGGDNLLVKGLYFKNTLRLAIFRAEL